MLIFSFANSFKVATLVLFMTWKDKWLLTPFPLAHPLLSQWGWRNWDKRWCVSALEKNVLQTIFYSSSRALIASIAILAWDCMGGHWETVNIWVYGDCFGHGCHWWSLSTPVHVPMQCLSICQSRQHNHLVDCSETKKMCQGCKWDSGGWGFEAASNWC